MAIGTGHRSNNYSESKRNDHLDNNRRQEQRNKGIPNKSHPNFREEHKSFSSIFVSNIPWNASVQDLWDICNKWGVVIDVYIAAKRSKSGHRFGFVRFINVNDINQLVSNLRTIDGWFSFICRYDERPGHKSVDMSGIISTSNAGAESLAYILAKLKILSVISELLKHNVLLRIDDVSIDCPEKDSIIAPPSIPPGNDLNILLSPVSS
ncbi:nucleotide-binding alpha-beta plait domain-containing protein [Tanacetum coccineum]